MTFYKGTKAMVRSPNSDTDFFDMFAGILQGNNIAIISIHNLPTLLTSNVFRSNKKTRFYTKK